MKPAETLEKNASLMRLATYASVFVAVCLSFAKFAAWTMTGSIAMFSSLVDSFLDVLVSAGTLWAVKHALKPADNEHRFGHGKAEPLAGLAQAAFISGLAFFLIVESTSRFLNPHPVVNVAFGVYVMIFGIVISLVLVFFQNHVVAKTNSVAIKADALHLQGDILINISVLISLLLGKFFALNFIDPLFALGIAGYMLFNASRIGKDSLDILMDKEFSDEKRLKIKEIALKHAEVKGAHDLRTRSSGLDSFIQLHLEMDRDMKLSEAHQVSDEVADKIRNEFPNADIIIHEDFERDIL
ncbi:MAG: cation diffusion facilitator family transporter [Alphaproteobacteria bacterium]|nr:cation diffusion facilitator family transporter [Alphaproteobacteria bacterium]